MLLIRSAKERFKQRQDLKLLRIKDGRENKMQRGEFRDDNILLIIT